MNRVKKIAVIGGESTGKSTLCASLATYFHTVWVAEFAREYLLHIDRPYTYHDLLTIAEGQIALENAQSLLANKFLFCDTNLHVIRVWSEHKYGKCHPYVLQEIQSRHYDAYILTAPDFPWQDDSLREHPDPDLRNYFFEKYKSIIEETHVPYTIVYGNEKERLSSAVTFMNECVK